MSIDYDWFRHRASQMYFATVGFAPRAGRWGKAAGQDTDLLRHRSDQDAAGRAGEVHGARWCSRAYLAEERSDEVSYPRFLGGLIIVGVAGGLIIIQPDLGTGSVIVAMAMGVLLVAGREGALHPGVHVPVAGHRARGLRRQAGQRLPAQAGAGAVRREQPGPRTGVVPGDAGDAGTRHRRAVRQGLAEGAAHEQRRHPRAVGRLPVRRGR